MVVKDYRQQPEANELCFFVVLFTQDVSQIPYRIHKFSRSDDVEQWIEFTDSKYSEPGDRCINCF